MAKPKYLDFDLRYHTFKTPCNFDIDFTNKTYWWTATWAKKDFFSVLEDNACLQEFVHDIRFDNAYLILDYSMDPVTIKFLEDNHLASVIKFFKEHRINFAKLIVLTASPDEFYFDNSTASFSSYILPNKVTRPYKHIFFNSLFQHTKLQFFRSVKWKEELEFKKQPTKHFMSLAHRDAIPRMLVNMLIHQNRLFDDNFISHNRVKQNDDLSDKDKFIKVKTMFINNDNIDLVSFLKYGFLRHRIDSPDTKTDATYPFSWQFELGSKVCFELITETCVAQNKRFVTEKVFKSMLSKNAFILAGNPHSLAWLKSLGFRTFSGIINEAYDYEEVFFNRLLIIFDEVKRLCNSDVNTLFLKIKKLNEVVEHNYQHYLHTVWDFSVLRNIQLHMDETAND